MRIRFDRVRSVVSVRHGLRLRVVAAVTILVTVAVFTRSAFPGPADKKSVPPGTTATQPTQKKSQQKIVRAKFLDRYKLKGRVALIEFGLVGCPLSDKGLKRMEFLHRRKAIPGLEYVRVEASKDDKAVKQYYQTKSLKFPVHRDPDATLARAFDATAYGTFIIVGRFGRIRYRGKCPDNRLRKWVAGLLAEKTDPGPNVPLLGAVKLDAPKLLTQTKLPDLRGRVKVLGELMGQGGLLIMFVDVNCPFSAKASTEIPAVAQTLSGLKINSVLINLEDSERDVKRRFGGRGTGPPVFYDVTSQTKSYWNVLSVPTVMFINSDKKIGYNGKAVWADLAAGIEKAKKLKKGSIQFTAKGTEFG